MSIPPPLNPPDREREGNSGNAGPHGATPRQGTPRNVGSRPDDGAPVPLLPPPPTGAEAPSLLSQPVTTPPPPRKGRLVGGLSALAFWILATAGWSRFGPQNDLTGLLITLVASVPLATLALVSERLRPYATGFLIVTGCLPVVLGGACIGLLAIITSSH